MCSSRCGQTSFSELSVNLPDVEPLSDSNYRERTRPDALSDVFTARALSLACIGMSPWNLRFLEHDFCLATVVKSMTTTTLGTRRSRTSVCSTNYKARALAMSIHTRLFHACRGSAAARAKVQSRRRTSSTSARSARRLTIPIGSA